MTRALLVRVLFALIGVAAALDAQSLGEVAKKTEEDRAANAKQEQTKTADTKNTDDTKTTDNQSATKVYTNKDLTYVPPSPVAAPAETKTTTKDASKPDEPMKDETYWRARVAPLHQAISENVVKAWPLRRRINDLTFELLGIGPLNTRRGGVETERQRLITEVEALDRSRNSDTQALKAIEEEGRRASALPGWFR
jgi:hypothetical protein